MVALIVPISIIGYVIYDNTKSHFASTGDVIEMDDVVTMNYIGRFTNGLVFDTSLLDVATDDVLYPKCLTYTMRDNESYTPFEMTAGKYGVEGGTIKGFALGVIGLSVGDTEEIYVAPEDAYAANPDMIDTVPLVQRVNATETIPETSFDALFKIDAVVMDHVPHYKWKWDVVVTSVEFGFVTFKHFPTVGETVYPFGDPLDMEDPAGWACTVESFDPLANDGVGEVLVRHDVSSEDVYDVKGEIFDGGVFVISSFDSENETFDIHRSDFSIGYNGEISGRALYFEVTIISVRKM